MWGKVSCLRKQHDGRDWPSNHRPSDLKSNALNTTSPRPQYRISETFFLTLTCKKTKEFTMYKKQCSVKKLTVLCGTLIDMTGKIFPQGKFKVRAIALQVTLGVVWEAFQAKALVTRNASHSAKCCAFAFQTSFAASFHL